MKDINNYTDRHISGLINSAPMVLIKVYAPWCQPCKILKAVIVELEQEGSMPALYSINSEMAADWVVKQGIRGVPGLILYRQGVQIDKKVGLTSKSNLRKWISGHQKCEA